MLLKKSLAMKHGFADKVTLHKFSPPFCNEFFSLPNQRFFPLQFSRSHPEVQYLLLDHETRSSPQPIKGTTSKNIIGPPVPSVVYQPIDFVKTDAFNKMRMNVEDTYRKNQ